MLLNVILSLGVKVFYFLTLKPVVVFGQGLIIVFFMEHEIISKERNLLKNKSEISIKSLSIQFSRHRQACKC